MHRFLIVINLMLSMASCGLTASKPDQTEIRYFIFEKSKYMKLMESSEYRTFPWNMEKFRAERKNVDSLEEIVVTQSCGLFHVGLTGVWLENTSEGWLNVISEDIYAYTPGGEFCNIGSLLTYEYKLLQLRQWKGKYYLIDSWNLYLYKDETLVFYDNSAAESLGLKEYYRDINPEHAEAGCRHNTTPNAFNIHLETAQLYVEDRGEEYCFTKAIFLEDVRNVLTKQSAPNPKTTQF